MPTEEEFRELIDNTSSEWVFNYNGTGVNGRLFTANNGKSIFLPAAGERDGTSLVNAGFNGYYWSRTLYADRPYDAYNLSFGSGYMGVYGYSHYRDNGYTVRPVRP